MRKTSDIIRERLVQAKANFRSNDNISKYIKPGEMDLLQAELQYEFEKVLQKF